MRSVRSIILLVIALSSLLGSGPALSDNMEFQRWYFGSRKAHIPVPNNDPEEECRNSQAEFPHDAELHFRQYGTLAKCYWFGLIGQRILYHDYRLHSVTKSCPANHFFNPASFECEPAEPARPNDGPPCCESPDGIGVAEGNPINAATGNKFQVETDYRGTAAGTLAVKRYYNSAGFGTPPFGRGWGLSYQRNIHVADFYSVSDDTNRRFSSRAIVTRDDGQQIPFTVVMSRDGEGDYFVPAGQWQGPSWSDWSFYKTDTGYRLESREGDREFYDADGHFLSRVSSQGLTTTIHRNGTVLQAVTGPFGRQVKFHYEEDALKLELPDGSFVHYLLDEQQRLAEVSYPDGSSVAYIYENANFTGALTGIIDAAGNRYATWRYDESGRAVSSEHANGAERVELEYLLDGSVRITTAAGPTRRREFVAHDGLILGAALEEVCDTCGSRQREVEYDQNGRVASATDFSGAVTKFTRNVRGFITSRTDASGTALARTVLTEWHPQFRVPVMITQPGRITEYTNDDSGNRLTETVTDSVTGASRTTTWTNNAFGQVLTVDGPRTDINDIATRTYDTQGNLAIVTNALGHLTRYTRYDAHGNPLEIVDPNGAVTELEYDLRQRLIRRSVAAGTAHEATTTFDYDALGQLVKTTLPNGAWIGYEYDAAHRMTAIHDSAGNRVDYILDAMGNRVDETVTGPGGTVFRETFRDYNELNRLVTQSGPAGSRVDYAYDPEGKRTSVTDANSNTTTSRYDALDRLFETVDALSGVTSYEYDASDNLTQVIDPRGVTTDYTYNGFNELIETDSPDAGVTTYTYDKAGNRIRQTDARGVTVSYQYDVLNRLTFIDYPGTDQDIRYTYDEGINGVGRLSSITDETGRTEYSYGIRGNLTHKLSVIEGETGEQYLPVGYGFDSADNLTSIIYPSGNLVQYLRDPAGRITALTLTKADGTTVNLVTGIQYAPFGPVNALTFGNGITETRGFDREGRISRIASGVLDYGYAWDATGNITAITDNLDATRTQAFDYDALYRLTSAIGIYGEFDYEYDAVGNRLRETDNGTDTVYGYAPDSNRLASIAGPEGTASYTYDASGNTLDNGEYTFDYDARNRFTAADGLFTYAHNALGQRVIKPRFQTVAPGDASGDGVINENDLHVIKDIIKGRVPQSDGADCNQDGAVDNRDMSCVARQVGATKNKGKGKNREEPEDARIGTAIAGDGPGTIVGRILFVYDEVGHLLGEYDELGNVIREYIWLGDRPVVMLSDGEVHYIHSDHLNTPKVVTDEDQSIVWRADYQPFGEITEKISTVDMPLRFAGQYFDEETGLHQNYFREYQPGSGRYLQNDPIGLAGGLNTYRYVLDPLTSVDPLGLARWTVTNNFEFSGVVGIGGGVYSVKLESKCYEGKKYKIHVVAAGPAAGLQLKCRTCFTAPVKVQVSASEFEDMSGSDRPQPRAFNGPFLAVSAEAQFMGFGGGKGDVLLGRARSVGSTAVNIGMGTFGLGVMGIIGTSTVVDMQTEQCDTCE